MSIEVWCALTWNEGRHNLRHNPESGRHVALLRGTRFPQGSLRRNNRENKAYVIDSSFIGFRQKMFI